MKILHTADWHLGQSLHQFERSLEHERFLDWLLELIEAEAIDVVLVAGDVFDTANPSAAAQAMFYRFLAEARRRVPGLGIVVTAGNHDSPARLEAASPLLHYVGATVVGQAAADEAAIGRLVVPLADRAGRVGAWCIAMPFLRPGDVPRIEGGSDPYTAGIAAMYAAALAVALARRAPGQAIVAMGHCHVVGGRVSEDSERPIVVGGVESMPAGIFAEEIDYLALGHLHLAQTVGGNPTRRYSGSPLPMSFSEIAYPHQVLVVELAGGRVAEVRAHRVPRLVELLRVPPAPAPLAEVLAALAALELPARPDALWPYLQVRVLLEQPEPGLRSQIEQALAGRPVRLARIETRYAARDEDPSAAPSSLDELEQLSPGDFFVRLYRHRFGDEPGDDLRAAFDDLVGSEQAAETPGTGAAA